MCACLSSNIIIEMRMTRKKLNFDVLCEMNIFIQVKQSNFVFIAWANNKKCLCANALVINIK